MPPAKPLGGPRKVVRIALVVLVVFVLLGFFASKINLNSFAISPGGAQPVAPLIKIDGKSSPPSKGKILLTDVLLTQITALNWIQYKLDSSSQIIPADALVQPGVSPSQLDAQGYLEMAQSKTSAKVAALRRLDYQVPGSPDGAVVTAVGEHAPASGALHVADIVVAVGGSATKTSCDVIRSLHATRPGTRVTLSVRPATIHGDGTITNGHPVDRFVTVGSPPASSPPSSCAGVSGKSTAYLGVSLESDLHYSYPLHISISTPNIGGPSAGLAMTLGIIDQLSHGALLQHKTIAATGTISPQGAVGDVGGVPQKAIAVSRAGATLFLVPSIERGPASSTASSTVRVEAVDNLDQALSDLAKLGGTITLADGSVKRPL